MNRFTRLVFWLASLFLFAVEPATARDYFLTIGGGYSPAGNQASLEKNVLFFQRLLTEQNLDRRPHDIFFADGESPERDLKVVDRESVPTANRLMAEFFGTDRDLGLSYRNHKVPSVQGATSPRNIRRWFAGRGQTMRRGDRLFLYVTSHGDSSDDDEKPYDTSISLWNDNQITVSELAGMLDRLPDGVGVVTMMVQCHAGGFARLIFDRADPDRGIASQQRIGFFATMHDREAAGCTAEIDETTYVEYSTYFWEALGGRTRLGKPIDPPDYDGDGRVSFDEAHAYAVLVANTIDLPIKTSGEFLRSHSKFGDHEDVTLLARDAPYGIVQNLATPAQRAVLDGLSDQLELVGDDRLEAAREQVETLSRRRQRGRGRRFGRRRTSDRPVDQLRRRIANDIEEQWPELANVLNPIAVDLVSTRNKEFIQAIEGHADYQRYRELAEREPGPDDREKHRVKFERFIRFAENVILAENLKRSNDPQKLPQFRAIVHAEGSSLQDSASP
jgi:hypothetical protein